MPDNVGIGLPGATNIAANTISLSGNTITYTDIGTDIGNSNSDNTISLPETSDTNQTTGTTKTGSKKNVGQVISDIANGANTLASAYNCLTSTVKNITGKSLPGIDSNSKVGKVLSGVNAVASAVSAITGILSGSGSGGDSTHTQTDSTNPQPGAFKSVELESLPGDFVSYDSVLLFVGEPIYADNPKGNIFTPLGLCEQFSISTAVQVLTIQELRCEEHIVLPGKTQPINITLTRFCGKWANLLNRLHGVQDDLKWSMSNQYSGMRKLFGLYCIVMDTSRKNIIHSFYVERCAIEQLSLGIAAGQMQVVESCTIRGGRIIDPNHVEELEEESIVGAGEDVDTTTTIDGQEVNTNEIIPQNYVLDADGNKCYEDGSYEDVNGNYHDADGTITYRNGDQREPDGTYYASDQIDNYKNTKEYKEQQKEHEKAIEAREDAVSAKIKANSLQREYSEAVNSGASQEELVSISKKMAKANEKYEKKLEKAQKQAAKSSAAITTFKNKVTEINKKNNVSELH